jgi:predicted NUDIX family phosphoesterase
MEFVLVVPRRDLFRDCYPQGLVLFGERGQGLHGADFEERVRQHGYFVEREHAEHDPELKQVIPYTLVVRSGQVLLLRRLARGGETRLHDKLSIGVGGHINPQDAEQPTNQPTNQSRRSGHSAGALEAGTRRELEEELHIESDVTIQRVGIINDDSNPVGAVHVGLVQVVQVRGDVRVREDEVLEGSFVAPAKLRRLQGDEANFETWSAMLIDRLHEVVPDSPVTVS